MKVLDKRKLPEDRLATTDEKGSRVYVFPASVKGLYRTLRTSVQAVLIVILLLLPWIKVGGHQALLLDIVERKFSVFGLTFWAHDGPLIFFILALLTIGLAFVTAVWGRVWCGWACPQTVFIDGVFRRIEYWIIGSHIKQRNLARSGWNGEKVVKYSAVWSLFTIVSLIVAHSFLAYFVGAERLVEMTQLNPGDNWTVFLVMAFITGVILFDFGWFREQFCIIMCPYGRIQSVLMDESSINVSYDFKRGEPRRGTVNDLDQEGDCIDCFRCVDVCPTGIDIRKGLQMECIACTACMDACDEVMTKVDKPKGLIRYASEQEIEGATTRFMRPRTIIYSLLLLTVAGGLLFNISNRQDVMITILRGTDSPYQVVNNREDGAESVSGDYEIVNHFKSHFKNQSFDEITLSIELPEALEKKGVEVITQSKVINIQPGKNLNIHFFVRFPQNLVPTGSDKIELNFRDVNDHRVFKKEVRLVGPKSI